MKVVAALAGVLWIAVIPAALAEEATPAAPATHAPSVRKACTADAKTYCHGILPGLGRLKSCMKSHYDELSEACRTAIEAAEARKKHADAPAPSLH